MTGRGRHHRRLFHRGRLGAGSGKTPGSGRHIRGSRQSSILRPLDTAAIVKSVQKTNRIVTVEEGWPFAGIGAEIASVCMEQAFDYLDAPVTRVTGEDAHAICEDPRTWPRRVRKIAKAAKAVCYASWEATTMAVQILMPALSPTMTKGIGELVETGRRRDRERDVIAEIETDKATMEVEAVDEGTLGKILVAAGTEGVAVNQPIAILLEEGEDDGAMDGLDAARRRRATLPGGGTGAFVRAGPAFPRPGKRSDRTFASITGGWPFERFGYRRRSGSALRPGRETRRGPGRSGPRRGRSAAARCRLRSDKTNRGGLPAAPGRTSTKFPIQHAESYREASGGKRPPFPIGI